MSSKLFKNFIKKAILNKQGAPGPAPRQGLVWKPQTHRWIKDPSAVDQRDDDPMAERVRVANSMDTIISDAMLDIQDDWGGRQGEMDGPTMEAKLREKLAEVYTTGADPNVFPHEEIAEAIGESPQAVDGYFADDFNIDEWHEAPPMDLRGAAGDINNHVKEVLPSLIEQGYDEEDALGYFYAGWALDGETLDGVSVQEVLGLGHLGNDQEADDLSNLIEDAIEEHYNG